MVSATTTSRRSCGSPACLAPASRRSPRGRSRRLLAVGAERSTSTATRSASVFPNRIHARRARRARQTRRLPGQPARTPWRHCRLCADFAVRGVARGGQESVSTVHRDPRLDAAGRVRTPRSARASSSAPGAARSANFTGIGDPYETAGNPNCASTRPRMSRR